MSTELDTMWDQAEELEGFTVFEDDYDENESTVVVRGQYIMDGSETLEEASENLRAMADIYDDLRAKGYELTTMVEDDYGVARWVG